MTTSQLVQTKMQLGWGSPLYSPHTIPLHPSLQRTEEKALEEALEEIGPYVALTRPGEEEPPGDASRISVPENWQEEVRKCMPEAQLVVIRLGMTEELRMTEGLDWEVKTAIKHVEPKRLVLLVPWAQNLYEAFRSKYATEFPAGLPEYGARWFSKTIGSLHGIIYFAPDWTPHFLRFKNYSNNTPITDNIALKRTFIPVVKQLGFSRKRQFLSYDFSIRKPE